MGFLDYLFSEPSFLFIVAIVFLVLGSAITYLIMKPKSDYVKYLQDENKQLKQSKQAIFELLNEYKEVENAKKSKR